MEYLEITPEQAHELYLDVQVYTNRGSGSIVPWLTPEMCIEWCGKGRDTAPTSYYRLEAKYKWYIKVREDSSDSRSEADEVP